MFMIVLSVIALAREALKPVEAWRVRRGSRGTAGAWMFMIALSVISFWLVRRLLKPVEA